MRPDEDAATTRQAWWMVAALFALYILAWLDRLMVAMLVAPIKAQLALSDLQMSLVLGPSFAVAYAIFGIPLGWAADRFSRRRVIFTGVFIWACATLACGFADSFEALIMARIWVGIGEAALLPSAYSLIGDAFPPHRVTMATSVFQSAGKTGSALSFGLGGLIVAFAQSFDGITLPLHGSTSYWQLSFALVALPGFALMFLAFSFPEPVRRNASVVKSSRRELMGFLREHAPLLSLMAFGFSCMAVIGYSLTSWVPSYMERHFGWHPARYGPALSAMNIFGAMALIACGRAVDRLYLRGMNDAHLRFYSWTILAASPAIAAAFFVTNPLAFLACYAIIQLITVPFMVYAAAIFAILAPSSMRGQLIGIMMFLFNILGFGAGPTIVGALNDFLSDGQDKIGASLAIVVISGAVLGFAAIRLAIPRLSQAVQKQKNAAA